MISKEIDEREFIYPDGYAGQIATAINSWAYLEHNVDRAIWQLAGTWPALGACMTAQIGSLTSRLNALLALMKLRRVHKKLQSRVHKFAETARGPTEFRNRIVHDPWFMTSPRGQLAKMQVTAPKSLTYAIKPVSLDDLIAQVQSIQKLRSDFSIILNEIIGAMPSLPDIPDSALDPITYNLRVRQNPTTETQ